MSDDGEDSGIDPNAWMVTFSDLLSLLMTFFVLLLSMSSLDNKKLKDAVGAFNAYLGVLEFGDSIKIGTTKDKNMTVMQRVKFHDPSMGEKSLKVAVEELIVKEGWSDVVDVHQDADRLVLMFHESILFISGSNEPLESSKKVIKNLVNILNKVDYHIRVEGHTDNRPIESWKHTSNWDLSIGRAVSVLELMETFGLPSHRLSVVGYGDSKPVINNKTEENRRANRRVELTMMIKPEEEE